MKLVHDWKKLRHAVSVQMMGLSSAILATWLLMPQEWKDSLPEWAAPTAALSFLACGFIGRFIKQDKVSGDD